MIVCLSVCECEHVGGSLGWFWLLVSQKLTIHSEFSFPGHESS